MRLKTATIVRNCPRVSKHTVRVTVSPGTDLDMLMLNQINMYRRQRGLPQMQIVPPQDASAYVDDVHRELAHSEADAETEAYLGGQE